MPLYQVRRYFGCVGWDFDRNDSTLSCELDSDGYRNEWIDNTYQLNYIVLCDGVRWTDNIMAAVSMLASVDSSSLRYD